MAKKFPKTKIKLQLFEKDRLNEGDLIKDFCGQARITPGADWNLYVHNFTKQEEPFRITLEQKQAYEQHYAESNETIRGRYFPNQSTLWSEKQDNTQIQPLSSQKLTTST